MENRCDRVNAQPVTERRGGVTQVPVLELGAGLVWGDTAPRQTCVGSRARRKQSEQQRGGNKGSAGETLRVNLVIQVNVKKRKSSN